MYIYHLESILFKGSRRTIITSFPVRDKKLLEKLANEDNSYPEDRNWKLVNIVANEDDWRS